MRHVAYCFALLFAAGSAFGQAGGTGSIQGTVTDPSGAVVAGASVTATNLMPPESAPSARPRTRVSLCSRCFPPGEYTVTVTATGFQTLTQTRVAVDALAVVGLDLKLQIGAASQSVTVVRRAIHAEDGRCRARRSRYRTTCTIRCRWR